MKKFAKIEQELHKHPKYRGAGVVLQLETVFDAKGKPHDRFSATFRTTGGARRYVEAQSKTLNGALRKLDAKLTGDIEAD